MDVKGLNRSYSGCCRITMFKDEMNRYVVDRYPSGIEDIKSKMFNVLWELKKKGYSESTVKNSYKALKYLNKHSNLDDAGSVIEFIVSLDRSPSWKKNLCRIYGYYSEYYNLEFDKPRFILIDKLPKIPLEEHVNYIILNASRKYASAFSIIRDSGIRPIECARIRVKDIDFTNKTITVRTAKGGLGRIVKLKDDTIARLKDYLGHKKLGLNDSLYPSSVAMGVMWRWARKRAVDKTKLLELESIRLYDLRHLHATMLYHKTKDILFVKQQLGHRHINSTLRYTQLVNFQGEEYTVRVANNLVECTKLLESGFEYVTDFEDKKVFRKRK